MIIKVQNELENYFVPDFAIVGLYHKIRISYQYISEICSALHDYFNAELTLARESENTEQSKSLIPPLTLFLNGTWQLTLTTSTSLKEEIISDSAFYSFNGAGEKASILFNNLPKYIWRCRIVSSDATGLNKVTDILFDATEVPQGRVVIGYISYTKEIEECWLYVASKIKDRAWYDYSFDDTNVRKNIAPILKFFSNVSSSSTLNAMYGTLTLPRRPLKPGETDHNSNIQNRRDTLRFVRGSNVSMLNNFLDKEKRYIWVIDELGDLVLGEDINRNDATYEGHPTLIDGKPARIAGELYFDEQNGTWDLNAKSRAYSSHIENNGGLKDAYLKVVKNFNFIGLVQS
jgi:hypothetical protein